MTRPCWQDKASRDILRPSQTSLPNAAQLHFVDTVLQPHYAKNRATPLFFPS